MAKRYFKNNRNKGAAMLISVVFFLFITLAIISGLVSPTVRELKNAGVNLGSKKSYFLAESGGEDALYRILNNLPIEESETLVLDSNEATTTITDVDSHTKQIISLGDVSNYQRKTVLSLSTDEGISFNYGMQVGTGGLTMNNNATINGNVYVNGNITDNNSGKVIGTAIAVSTIGGLTVGQLGVGDAKAHTVNNSTIAGALYCQTGSGNNKSCNTSQADPVPLDFPISDEQIQGWKDEALVGDTETGDINLSDGTLTVGPKKIEGNITLSNDAILTVTGTLWVTGDITISNQSKIRLSSSYGSGSGVIVADGTITTNNSASFSGSGTSGSYIMMLTTSTSSSAVTVNNSAGTVILVAPYGNMIFNNSASAKEAIANQVTMNNNSVLNYETGLINVNFVSGPSGTWTVDSWKEAE
ncbi:MAG: hypothetical protein UX77_C0004G0020 [Parcubacteria group bacterium GW2011_GWA1_47_11]|uniref:Uncharacterized protein n=1 Tax=Candidatus Nomurabacteria bacterium GW2011_GWB1_47_6 TaxID=1618749 RepID=A0A0G1T2E9_9BACT|nr:MAG: hypothetical protein UX77_C0004G0020 [Parcubacteria group bacterium GW2011_GWA1_47_11]KKU75922.1 MAG: hypothetical protein UY01_C0001G0018 [Candidatus Nomurabacteria bacterium GW2011_GWB1_47_6]